MKRKNKIEASLSEDGLKNFIGDCSEIKGLTLSKIQKLAKEYGIEVSLMGAKTFYDKTYDGHIARLQKAKEAADLVSRVGIQNSGSTLADAAAGLLSQQVFEKVNDSLKMAADLEDLSPMKVAAIIESLRREDRKVEQLRLQHEKYKEQVAEKKREVEAVLKKGKKDGGISKETVEQIEQTLKLL